MSSNTEQKEQVEDRLARMHSIGITRTSEILTQLKSDCTAKSGSNKLSPSIEKTPPSSRQIGKYPQKVQDILNTNPDLFLAVQDVSEEDKLYLIHYNKTLEKNTKEFAAYFRGPIFNEKGMLVVPSLTRTSEIVCNKDIEQNGLDSLAGNPSLKCLKSIEGTLIRVFFYGSKWYTSTFSKINAAKSKWPTTRSPSHEELFYGAISNLFKYETPEDYTSHKDLFLNSLDKNRIYMFILGNNRANRSVSFSEKAKVYLLGIFIVNTFEEREDNIQGILKTSDLRVDLAGETLTDYIRKIDPSEMQGVILSPINNPLSLDYHKPGDCSVKIYNQTYMDHSNLRNNAVALDTRYVELFHDEAKRSKFRSIYADSEDKFQKCEERLRDLARCVMKVFAARYIEKRYIFTDQYIHSILRLCQERITAEAGHLKNSPRTAILTGATAGSPSKPESSAGKPISSGYKPDYKPRRKMSEAFIYDSFVYVDPLVLKKAYCIIKKRNYDSTAESGILSGSDIQLSSES